MKLKKIWRDEDCENDTCEVVLWAIDLPGKGTVWAVTGDGKIIDVTEETEGEDVSTCVRENEIIEEIHDSAWSEDITHEKDELLLKIWWSQFKWFC